MAGKSGIVTPAGWSFHEPPAVRWRHYRYRDKTHTPATDQHPDGLEILSVTQALGVLDKSGPLQHYAARMTIEGASKILTRYGLERTKDGHLPSEVDLEDLCLIAGDPVYFNEQLKRARLTFYFKTDDAARRGTAMHTVLEDWIERGRFPTPKDHPVPYQGFVRGLGGFLLAHRPTFLESEMIVGSVEYGVAGARDTVLVLHDPVRGRALIDLKTSKGVYPSSHFRQITAYDRLGVLSGEEPTDSQGILRVGEDGSWEIRWLQDFGEPEFFWRAFLNALDACRDERWITKRGQALERQANAANKKAAKARAAA